MMYTLIVFITKKLNEVFMTTNTINKQKTISEIEINYSNINHNKFKEKTFNRGFWWSLGLAALTVTTANADKIILALHSAGIIGK